MTAGMQHMNQGVIWIYELAFEKLLSLCVCGLELLTFEILAAERLRLMGFYNRLIIDCFANVVNILIWLFSSNDRFRSGKYESNYLEKESIHCRKHIAMTKAI